MKTNEYGEIIFSQQDIFDILMQGKLTSESDRLDFLFDEIIIDEDIDLTEVSEYLSKTPKFRLNTAKYLTVQSWHNDNQNHWQMPYSYRNMDIAAHVLSLCQTQEQLQRVGEELLLYQERNLFDLLRYLKYLVDTMKQHEIVWGVGRGSSVASYVLYLLEVHRIDSMYYDLDCREFLR